MFKLDPVNYVDVRRGVVQCSDIIGFGQKG